MSPSLSGHTLILAEICSYLRQHELSCMLRVDKQTYHIAGRQLYRYLSVPRHGRSPLPSLATVLSWARTEKTQSPWKINRLLEYVEVMDLSEGTLVDTSRAYTSLRAHGCATVAFATMTRLHTLVIRSGFDLLPGIAGVVGQGLQPRLLVVVGEFGMLARLLSYRRSQSDGPSDDPHSLTPSDTVWSSVLRLHHIIPTDPPTPYPPDFILQKPDCDVTASLPNIRRYDLFFDLDKARRDGNHRTEASRFESHFLRSVAWSIRNTRHTLPMTIWLSGASKSAFSWRKGHIKEMVRQPRTRAANHSSLWRERRVIDWGDKWLSERLALIEARVCGAEREKNWCGVSDGTVAYDGALLTGGDASDQDRKDGKSGEGQGYQVEVDWAEVEAEDDEKEDNFSEAEEEEPDEASDEDLEFDDYYDRRSTWGGHHRHSDWYGNGRSMYDSDEGDDEGSGGDQY